MHIEAAQNEIILLQSLWVVLRVVYPGCIRGHERWNLNYGPVAPGVGKFPLSSPGLIIIIIYRLVNLYVCSPAA